MQKGPSANDASRNLIRRVGGGDEGRPPLSLPLLLACDKENLGRKFTELEVKTFLD